MQTPPIAENFPRRNRIISGLALGVLVIEAPVRSGAMITARLATEEHGREALAVPGRADSPTSAGCHRMIREGWAALVTNTAEVLESLHEAGQLLKAKVTAPSADAHDRERDRDPGRGPGPSILTANLNDPQQKLMNSLAEPRSLDELVTTTGLPVPTLQANLTLLEIRGLVKRESHRYSRAGK
jgi:DNA processing protein